MKKVLFTIPFLILISNHYYSQTAVLFSQQELDNSVSSSALIRTNNNHLLICWADDSNKKLYISKSSNDGNTWSSKQELTFFPAGDTIKELSLATYGDIVLLKYGINYGGRWYGYFISTNNGIDWSSDGYINFSSGLNNYKAAYTSLGILSNNTFVFCHSFQSPPYSYHRGIYLSRFVNNQWSQHQMIDPTGVWGFVFSPSPNKDMVVFADSNGNKTDLYYRTSTDGGFSWSAKQLLLSTAYSKSRPQAIKSNNDIFIFYEEIIPTSFQNYYQKEVFFIRSTDNGQSWLPPVRVTKYPGDDDNFSVAFTSASTPVVAFTRAVNSDQIKQFNHIYLLKEPEKNSPPVLINRNSYRNTVERNSLATVRAFVDYYGSIESVKLIVKGINRSDTLTMYDDGLHQDSLAGDKIYGASVNIKEEIKYLYVKSVTTNGLSSIQYLGYITSPQIGAEYETLTLRRYLGNFSNTGVIGSGGGGVSGILYDNKEVFFSGGFFLVGKNQNEWWANGVFFPSRINDYLPGLPGVSNDPRYGMYIIKSTNPPFGESWQNWRFAVELGADFYDGDGDGIYNPVDLNGNGIWDNFEDRPDLLGDITLWCVYNDSQPPSLRRFFSVQPLGITIKQTTFSVLPEDPHQADNIFFVRYRISQNGSVAERLDSVYFMIMTDPDIGNFNDAYLDDLVGCDTLLYSGYTYNDGEDADWGFNPPAISTTLLQGPIAYIPGITFIDSNSNEKYDDGIDTPLDTAYNLNGYYFRPITYPGANNLRMNSFIHLMFSLPIPIPSGLDIISLRNYALGLDWLGNIFDPCTWLFGEVRGGIPCELINPVFLYSGDPVNNTGWINIFPTDQRMSANVGPFELIANQEIDIWVAYVAGRGTDALNSVTVLKENIQYAIDSYKSNFTNLPGAEPFEFYVPPPKSFKLYQNYPNPFNPTTKISWQTPAGSWQTLKVYDILGNEVATLVDEYRDAGKYEITFNASNLASGVYFYRLKAGNYIETKKMMLLR